MASHPSDRGLSPLVKGVATLFALTSVAGGFLVYRQLAPKPKKVAEPPPLVAMPEDPADPPPPRPVVHAPKPTPVAATVPPPAPAPATDDIARMAKDQVPGALTNETDPLRKIALIKRLVKDGLPQARYAAAVLFADPDKRVRIEAIRSVEAMDTENRILMPKVHAVYMYESDPEVKAELDRLVQKFRPQEEAEYKARQAQAANTNGQSP